MRLISQNEPTDHGIPADRRTRPMNTRRHRTLHGHSGQPQRIPVVPPKRHGNLEHILYISSRTEILQIIEEYIGDIRLQLMLIRGLNIAEVKPHTFTAILNGSPVVFPSSFDLNLLKEFNHHGDPMQYPINAILPPEKSSRECADATFVDRYGACLSLFPSYNRAYRRPDQRYIKEYIHHMASDRAARLLRPRLGRTILPTPYA